MDNQTLPPIVKMVCETLCRNAFDPTNSHNGFCPECKYDACTMWSSFKQEAEAVIKAIRQFDKVNRR